MPEPLPVPVPLGPRGTLDTPVPIGLLPTVELIGYGAEPDSVLAGTGSDAEPETPVLRGTVGTTNELEIGVVSPPVLMIGSDAAPVPESSEVDTGAVLVGELRIEVELY